MAVPCWREERVPSTDICDGSVREPIASVGKPFDLRANAISFALAFGARQPVPELCKIRLQAECLRASYKPRLLAGKTLSCGRKVFKILRQAAKVYGPPV